MLDLLGRSAGSWYHPSIHDPTRMTDPNRVQGSILYTGTLYLFFFFLKDELVPVGIKIIFVITKIIYIYKRTTIGVVSIKIYTHILSRPTLQDSRDLATDFSVAKSKKSVSKSFSDGFATEKIQ